MKRHVPDLDEGRCCWVCGKPGGMGFTTALRLAGYDVPMHGVIAYAHSLCMHKAAKKAADRARAAVLAACEKQDTEPVMLGERVLVRLPGSAVVRAQVLAMSKTSDNVTVVLKDSSRAYRAGDKVHVHRHELEKDATP